jgi:hypothetical protein
MSDSHSSPESVSGVGDLLEFAKEAESQFRQKLSEEGATLSRARQKMKDKLSGRDWLIPPHQRTSPLFIWFRGQPLSGDGLVPKCRRQTLGKVAIDENHFNTEFMVSAPNRSSEALPENNNYAEWLALAQHYGLPTRLLDWSASILTAAFFAVDGHLDEDGVVYAISPTAINAEYGEYIGPSMVLLDNYDTTLHLLREKFDLLSVAGREKAIAFAASKLKCGELSYEVYQRVVPPLSHAEVSELIAGAFGVMDTEGNKILAVAPRQETRRIMQQHGAFTIHSRNSAPLEQAECAGDFLRQVIIPPGKKGDIRRELKLLGVTRRQLFPDLDHLALDIIDNVDY